jgi:hypothetical protein
MQFAFNSGSAYTIDGDAVPTPNQIGILQSASVDLKATNKKLYGQNVLPVATGRSQIDVSGKLKFAQYRSRVVKDFFGSTQAAGQINLSIDESGTIPSSSVYTVTVAHSAAFGTDLGVVYAATGIPFVAVASGPTIGQYSYAAGVYTFAAADEGVAVKISYTYTVPSTGETISIANTSAGAANTFKTVVSASYNGLQANLTLNACVSSSLKLLDTKIGDFSMPELDFDALVDSAGNLGTFSLAEAS